MAFAKGVGAFVVSATAGFGGVYATDDGVRRSTRFWVNVFPIYARYRYNQIVTERALAAGTITAAEKTASFVALHEEYAPISRDLCLELRGFYLKQAQLMSVLQDDFVPPQYMAWMATMQDRAPTAMAPGEARAIVERELGAPVSTLFAEWEDEPCGCASIGQCHRATLPDGRRVAIKVMAPGVEARFRADMKTTIRFCELAMPQHVSPLQEIEKQFLTEFDYSLEARNLRLIHRNVTPVWGDRVRVPQPLEAMCSKNVLTMEYIPGQKLVDGIRAQWRAFAERNGTTLEELEAKLVGGGGGDAEGVGQGQGKQQLQRRTLAEAEAEDARVASLLRAKVGVGNALRGAYNWTVGLLPFVPSLAYASAEVPASLAALMKLVLDVHAHEILVDGAFNGDPHPGNILLCPDGRLGLIDYGQVKHIPLAARLNYAKLIIAINNGDAEEVRRISTEDCGNVTKHGRADVGLRLTTYYHDRSGEDVLQGLNVQEFMDWAEEEDPMVFVAPDYVMQARVSVMLRGISNAFGIDLHVTDYWRPHAEELLNRYGVPFKPAPAAAAAAAGAGAAAATTGCY